MNVQKRVSELIEIGRQEVVLDDQRLEQNRARILARALALGVVGAGVAAATSAGAASGVATLGSTAAAGAATKTLAAVSLAKWAVAAVVVGGSVGGTYALTSRTQQAPVSSQVAPIGSATPTSRQTGAGPAALAEKAPDSSVQPPDVEARPRSASAAAPGVVGGKPRPSASNISEHAELLRDARSALAAGDAARALTLLDARPEIGRGPLGPEWAAARILVLCRLGRVTEAKQLGQRFLKSHASSPLAAQVAASCAAKN